jgi:hypothetical protein
MDVAEVKRVLARAAVSPAAYRILEAPDENTWCLKRQAGAWVVFYFARGRRHEETLFVDEVDACAHLVERLVPGDR